MINIEVMFWFCIVFIFYSYIGYPILLYLWSLLHPVEINKKEINKYPDVSVVIAAHNEADNIKQRIENIILQDYPKKNLEIIIVSDGSNDNTNNIVEELMNKPDVILRLLFHNPAKGKPFSINQGVSASNGEIIVFTDCRQRFSSDAIRHLVNNFNDDKVGCVSGELVFKNTLGSPIQGEMGAYWNFEKWLRKLESKTGAVPGATGSIYAIRKNLFKTIPEKTLIDDVLIPLNISMQGYRVIFDSQAVAFDSVSKDLEQEKRRKIRTLAGNWQLFFLQPNLFNPLKNPLWIKFLSHKIFRLLIPYTLFILIGTTILSQNPLSYIILAGIALFFIIAVIPPLSGHLIIISRLSSICRSIILLNYFALLAPIKLILTPKTLW